MANEDQLLDLVDLRKLTFTGEAANIRKASGLSLLEIAGALRVNPSTVWRWENAKRAPTGKTALEYYRLLKKIHGAIGKSRL